MGLTVLWLSNIPTANELSDWTTSNILKLFVNKVLNFDLSSSVFSKNPRVASLNLLNFFQPKNVNGREWDCVRTWFQNDFSNWCGVPLLRKPIEKSFWGQAYCIRSSRSIHVFRLNTGCRVFYFSWTSKVARSNLNYPIFNN